VAMLSLPMPQPAIVVIVCAGSICGNVQSAIVHTNKEKYSCFLIRIVFDIANIGENVFRKHKK